MSVNRAKSLQCWERQKVILLNEDPSCPVPRLLLINKRPLGKVLSVRWIYFQLASAAAAPGITSLRILYTICNHSSAATSKIMKEHGINLYLSGMLNEKNNTKRGNKPHFQVIRKKDFDIWSAATINSTYHIEWRQRDKLIKLTELGHFMLMQAPGF